MGHEFIRIPPDSTGKKIRHTQRLDIEVTTPLINLNTIERGTIVVGKTSNTNGSFIGFGVLFGKIYIYLKSESTTFINGETLTINNVDVADIISFVELFTSDIHLSDPDNPQNKQKIDKTGSAYTRYTEGDLGFDAFGNAQFSQMTQIDNHLWTYGDNPSRYWDEILGGGSITSSNIDSSLTLSVDNIIGSKTSRTSHQYYPYNPGEGNTISMSILIGDEGKSGVVRRWGLYDNLDGVFFELNGTNWNVVQRSSTSGSPVDTIINRNNFNGDGLDNLNTSEYLIEFSKYNLYWIDYQWLGVGKVRLGCFSPIGKRVTIHTFKNPNQFNVPYMKRGTLPFKMEIYNESGIASSSEMKSVCTTIARQSSNVIFPGEIESYVSPNRTISGSTQVVIFSAKPMTTFNGVINRTTVIPTAFEVTVVGDPIRIDIIVNGFVANSTYVANLTNVLSSTLIDDVGTTIAGGTRMESLMFGNGTTHRILPEVLYNSLKLSANGTSQPIFSIVANVVGGVGSSNVSLIMRWKESR